MSKNHFRLTGVKALAGHRLHLTYADGQSFEVELSDWIGRTGALRRLRNDKLFAKARLAQGGFQVDWLEDEIELAADNLRNLAVEQAGGIGHERIWNWLHEAGLTLDEAAHALGISRRMLIYYRDGEKPIPRAVWLACLGWQAVKPKDASLPKRIPSPSEYEALHA